VLSAARFANHQSVIESLLAILYIGVNRQVGLPIPLALGGLRH